jgi:hypothetical protein
MKTTKLAQYILLLGIIIFWAGVISAFLFEWEHWAILVLIGWIVALIYPLWKKLY